MKACIATARSPKRAKDGTDVNDAIPTRTPTVQRVEAWIWLQVTQATTTSLVLDGTEREMQVEPVPGKGICPT